MRRAPSARWSACKPEELIKVEDAAIVSWPADKKKPKTRHLNDLTGAGALGGAFWGFLFGLIFFVPLLGLAVGAAAGALAGSLTHIGIDESFIKEVREKITPGTSALFVMTSDAVIDRVREAFPAADAELIHTNLSAEDEAKPCARRSPRRTEPTRRPATPTVLAAFLWGLFAASSLVIGGVVALRIPIPPRALGLVMAFGAGVLISAVAYDLAQESFTETGGLEGRAGPRVLRRRGRPSSRATR